MKGVSIGFLLVSLSFIFSCAPPQFPIGEKCAFIPAGDSEAAYFSCSVDGSKETTRHVPVDVLLADPDGVACLKMPYLVEILQWRTDMQDYSKKRCGL